MKATFISLSFDLRWHSLWVNLELTIQGNPSFQTLTYRDEDLYAMRDKLGQEDWDFGTICAIASDTLGGIEVLPPPEYLPAEETPAE